MPTLTFPNTIASGQALQAAPVMADFNEIKTLVNGLLDTDNIASLPTTKLTGTITNAQLAGSIAWSKLVQSDITLPTTQLSGTITNAQLAGSIATSKLSAAVIGKYVNVVNAGYLVDTTAAATTAWTSQVATGASASARAVMLVVYMSSSSPWTCDLRATGTTPTVTAIGRIDGGDSQHFSFLCPVDTSQSFDYKFTRASGGGVLTFKINVAGSIENLT